jgi:hypothetical protein
MDPYMLLSIVNLKLRDYYKNLEDLCDDLNWNKKELQDKLLAIGYIYNENTNQFVSLKTE